MLIQIDLLLLKPGFLSSQYCEDCTLVYVLQIPIAIGTIVHMQRTHCCEGNGQFPFITNLFSPAFPIYLLFYQAWRYRK
jgi:hypothetical protein